MYAGDTNSSQFRSTECDLIIEAAEHFFFFKAVLTNTRNAYSFGFVAWTFLDTSPSPFTMTTYERYLTLFWTLALREAVTTFLAMTINAGDVFWLSVKEVVITYCSFIDLVVGVTDFWCLRMTGFYRFCGCKSTFKGWFLIHKVQNFSVEEFIRQSFI